ELGSNLTTIRVEDGRGGSATQTFTINVVTQSTNHPPTITSQPPFSAAAAKEYVYNPVATDPDNDAIAWRLNTAPSGMSIDPATGAIRWTPAANQIGAADISLSALDPLGASSTQTW